MSEVKVCEGLEIINVDGHHLETLRKSSDTLEMGAKLILEGLSFFAEDNLLAKYEYDDEIPYKKLFYALKEVITTGCEIASVRDAIMTGALHEHMNIKEERRVKRVEAKPTEKLNVNKSAITLYAKSHKIGEITKQFGFNDTRQAANYLRYHHIAYLKSEGGGKVSMLADVDGAIREVAENMRLCELSRMFGVGKTTMLKYLTTHNINYKRGVRYAK